MYSKSLTHSNGFSFDDVSIVQVVGKVFEKANRDISNAK